MFPISSMLPTKGQVDQLEYEFDNLRAALRWWIELRDVEHAIRQACALFHVWYMRGYLTEGQTWLQEILALHSAPCNPASRRRALQMVAHLACRHADYVVALEALKELLI